MPHPNPYMERFAQAVARMENTEAGFLKGKNNPGALMYAGQAGASPYRVVGKNGQVIGTFATFRTPQDGWAALYRQIQINADKRTTIYTFFAGQRDSSGKVLPGGYPGYAPGQAVGHNNNPNVYANNVADWLGVPVETRVSDYLAGKAGGEESGPGVEDGVVEFPGATEPLGEQPGLVEALADAAGSWQGIPTLALWGAGLLLIAGLASAGAGSRSRFA